MFVVNPKTGYMITRLLVPGLAFLTIGLFSCSKDDMKPADCSTLQQAILTGNPDEVETEINRISRSLVNTPDSEEGLAILVNKISSQCSISAVMVCYGCIKTLPEQSEIKLSINNSGSQKNKIIDIVRSGDKFVFAGMHD